jgi:Fe/S biogenesis protein NfuA
MQSPMLTLTDAARGKIDGVRTFNEFPDAMLRVRVVGREGPRLLYEIALEDPRDRLADDIALDLDGLTVIVDPGSADDLRGSVIDLDSTVVGGGLRVDNPNEGWKDPIAARVQEVLDRQINPGVGTHGGMVSLLDVRQGTAYVRLGGGCQGCAAVDVTLRQGVETAIRSAVPEIVTVVDVTDHAAGTNPYYQRHQH